MNKQRKNNHLKTNKKHIQNEALSLCDKSGQVLKQTKRERKEQ